MSAMDGAGIGVMTGALAIAPADEAYGAVLQSATRSILGAQTFEAPYPLIVFRDFFPADFYRLLLKRFPDDERFVQLNGEGTRRQYSLYDEGTEPGTEEGRAAW